MTPPRRRIDLGRWLPALAPLALAAIAALLDHPERAAVLLGLAVLAAGLITAGVPVARSIEVAVVKVVRLLADVVLGVAFLLVAVPVWAWRTVTRRRAFDGEHGWRAAPGTGAPEAPGSVARTTDVTIRARVLASLGVVVVLLVADYAIGWTWDYKQALDDAPSAGSDVVREPHTDLPPDPRAGSDAMASAPWAVQYFEELRGQQFSYWPFTEDRPEDYETRYINVEDWVRRSWEPAGAAGAPTAWFFGGSAMFGEGQRDEHTIPSEVARLAEADGLPLVVRNYGQRGWVHMQEALLYEQQLALDEPPDLAVFYDGPNDLQAAAMFRDAVPSHLHADEYAALFHGKRLASGQVTEQTGPRDILDAYVAHSAVRKVVRWAVGQPADAAPSRSSSPGSPSARTDGGGEGTRDEHGYIIWGSVGDGKQGLEIYERARAISNFVGDRAGVDGTYFWQPVATNQPAVGYARSHLPDGVIDLSDVFAGQAGDVYIDTTHTNELGARLVAEAMWAELKPQVEAWYRANR